ncbi:MAG: hypothetical protein U5K43_05690 [Halofilum sp. (in: g-proteobacteria)]|nr:hypothetical protein [Halofilum sp. (in: g-proteobacteria)]
MLQLGAASLPSASSIGHQSRRSSIAADRRDLTFCRQLSAFRAVAVRPDIGGALRPSTSTCRFLDRLDAVLDRHRSTARDRLSLP